MPRLLTLVSIAVLSSAVSAFVHPAATTSAQRNVAVKAKALSNGFVPDATKDCYGLPGAGFGLGQAAFDPAGFCADKPFGEVQRIRESEIMHGRVAMMACVGYLVGESSFHPFNIYGPANDQLQQVPLPAFAAFTLAILGCELARAKIAFVEPGAKTDFQTIRADHYPGDIGFDPLGLKPKNAAEFEKRSAQEIVNGRLAMIGAAGMCAQELVNHETILPLQF